MAAKGKNRNKHQQQTNGANHHINAGDANTHNGASSDHPTAISPEVDESPLKLFGEAKEQIELLYKKLNVCVNEAKEFYLNNPNIDPDVLKNVNQERLHQLKGSIESIKGVLSRNYMKVAFFGHTSNGKSTVINAILHDNVLPRGYGVTTKCFLQIQGAADDDAYVLVQKKGQPEEKKPISFVTQMANALNRNSLECSTLLKIHWPISKCSLLKYDVVFVDSPGVNVDENLDEWIDDYCHDADVFVLVSSAESTLNIAEKNFFHKVSKKLSKPNIFILNNRFDIIDQNEPDSMDQVREQHVDRAVDFLSQELKLSTATEAKERTFFVSAKETLSDRCPQAAATGGFDSKTLRGYRQRRDEFQNFEKRFEESLSKSAVKTKFEKYKDKGLDTIKDLSKILGDTRDLVKQISHDKDTDLKKCQSRINQIDEIFYKNSDSMLKQMVEIKKRIQIVADTELDNEIRRLSRVVEDFEMEFSTNPNKINFYKEQLYLHVEECLSENLRARIITVISKHVNPFSKAMCELSTLLSSERQQTITSFVTSQNYIQDDLFDFKTYKHFYTGFQEDLEFRFSLGLVSIIRKFQSKFTTPKQLAGTSQSSNDSISALNADADVLSMFERFIMMPPQSPTTVGSIAVGGILVRTVGWKVIVITTVVYGTLYAYEYLTWTNSAKERAFKAQYVRYARKGLQDCIPIISQHIANSVEQKMTTVFGKLKEDVDVESAEVSERASLLKSSLEALKLCEDFSYELLGKNSSLMNEFVAFATSFLS